ncbi:DNA repair protein complementing XP-C cells isoform X2 [Sinocyclocheilus grahami]|uniref:Xeroderma pigmentosum, complementation group C n=2 Tax=Sinocyclocheilus grahami TaxID=75366 RepID=A0A672KQF5_SINGR|nr:PREDICTED: DNA repair protein complementing XP-C cells isoform X2 [Sinocyclocheilus grahami]
MAKRKETQQKTDTKKPKQIAKNRPASKTRKTKENSMVDKNNRKNSRVASRVSRKVRDSSDERTSKYFQDSEVKTEEPEEMSDHSEEMSPMLSELSSPSKQVKEDEEESEDEEDWEEVEEMAEPLGPVDSTDLAVASKPVEIEIETPDMVRKRQRKEKRKAEFETYLRRMMKRFNKELLVDTHKVHLLCLLAGGLFRSRLCCEPDLLAVALSILPAHFTTVATKRINSGFLEGLLKWFQMTFTLNSALPEKKGVELSTVLENRIGCLSARDHEEMTNLFLLVLRSLRLFCRLVLSLQPLPLKPPPASKNKTTPTKSSPEKDQSEKPSPEPKISPGTKRPSSAHNAAVKEQRGGKRKKKKEEGGEKEAAGGQKPKNSSRRSVASKVSYKEVSSEEEEEQSEEEFQPTNEDDSEDSDGAMKVCRKSKVKGKGQAPRRSSEVKQEEESEEEEEEEEKQVKKQRRKRKEGKGADEWLEVYLESTGKWVCVDVDQGVGQPQLCSNQATQPITYVVAVDDEGYLKDLSSRYDPTWLTSSRRRRVDSEWWEETMELYKSPDTERGQKENQEMQAKLLDKPLPTSISEYKNHPLYALKRHLLKYEAIYPSTAAVLGYCRGEPVYSRDCVHTLHSRDTWLKEARTVRLGEEPYKMVLGFSNRSRKARMISEQKDVKDLPLFGVWQTEEYQPPISIDGKVPRNEFGNVYMFKSCMLPVGCVHLHLPNLHRVARKLNIDCAVAVTGFDYHCGFAHAVNDGYIVCEEHQEILKAAWENEQDIQQKKEQEKREKRVVANWTLLVKGLLIKERLKRRYGQQGLASGAGLKQEKEGGAEGLSSDEEEEGGAQTAPPSLTSSWPQNRQEEQEEKIIRRVTKREKRGEEKNLFPFEKV